MPFLMNADAAARKIISAIERGKTHAVIPWQMAIVARLLRAAPDWLYDPLVAKPPRKPPPGDLR
jgi:short-subunit dehydrogenase